MKRSLILSAIIFLTGCNDNEVKNLQADLMEKEKTINNLLEENKKISDELEAQKSPDLSGEKQFFRIVDHTKIDLKSITMFDNPKSVNYDLYITASNGSELKSNSTILCDEAKVYTISLKSLDGSIRLGNHDFGRNHAKPILEVNKPATRIYQAYCLNDTDQLSVLLGNQ